MIENFFDKKVTWFLKKDFKYFKVYLDKRVLVKTNKKMNSRFKFVQGEK